MIGGREVKGFAADTAAATTPTRVHSCRFVVNELREASNKGTLRASVMLTVSQLSKSFAGRALFDDVSLQINRDDRTGA